jgi:hypothetical protein
MPDAVRSRLARPSSRASRYAIVYPESQRLHVLVGGAVYHLYRDLRPPGSLIRNEARALGWENGARRTRLDRTNPAAQPRRQVACLRQQRAEVGRFHGVSSDLSRLVRVKRWTVLLGIAALRLTRLNRLSVRYVSTAHPNVYVR